jgi:uncharacterized protein YbjQ (UPF0145 family)/predicted house-cleaning noncanonical NTP pyrophosphatase (MazG superfamily)
MGTFHNFILSTTSTLEGYKIKKYYGTVTSHVVAGTGLFSDFAAGMSDIFGGRSESYQKQLISIKEDVLKRLKEEAAYLGANGIVGLKVDFDEISGKGKTMFMVSALGTAVQIEFIGSKEEADLQSGGLTRVTSDELNLETIKPALIDSFNKSNYRTSKEDWEYITENAITEAFDDVFNYVKKISENWNEDYSDSYNYHKEYEDYLNNLPDEFMIENIYKLFYANHKKIKEIAFNLIDERELLNLRQLKIILNSGKIMAKKYALKTLYKCDKRFYLKEDVAEFEEIKNIVKINFPEVGERLSKKKLLSSNEVESWICPSCKKENSSEDKFCKKCGSDIRGFFEKDINPEDVIKDIDKKLEVLRKLLNK